MNMRLGLAACSALAILLMSSPVFAGVNGKAEAITACEPGPADLSSNGPFASLFSTGVVAHCGGIVLSGTKRLAIGKYQVQADRNIRGCAYIATIGNPGAGLAGFGYIHTARLSGSDDTVIVQTTNISGVASDRAFHLHIVCK